MATRTLAELAGPPRNTELYYAANDAFRNANKLAPSDVAVNTGWGELFLEKYDRPEAMKSFQEALKADDSYVPAILGVARVTFEGNPPAARAAIERALKINPNSVEAHLLSAEMALDDRKRDGRERRSRRRSRSTRTASRRTH